MKVLGIETSCDECSAAVVDDGRTILSNIVASQIEIHRPYYGVVPELASRKHVEWIGPVVEQSLAEAGVGMGEIDAVAATFRPGLIGSLLVGLSYGKGLALTLDLPFVGVDHIQAHLYAPHLEQEISYPYIGLIVSGGHTLIARVETFDRFEVLGTTIDDACGEAFDKVAKFYDLGFPGGAAIDRLSVCGEPEAFRFPKPSLHKGDHRYDVSYSGLKTAAVTQIDQFWDRNYEKSNENIAASFQKAAVSMLMDRVRKLLADTGLTTLAAGGGVAANSRLRSECNALENVRVVFPSMELCTDNGAMIAGIGYHYLRDGITSDLDLNVRARVPIFRKTYP